MFKPKITPCTEKGLEDYFICQADTTEEYSENIDNQYWWSMMAVGMGKSPEEAYKDWLKDCELPDELKQ